MMGCGSSQNIVVAHPNEPAQTSLAAELKPPVESKEPAEFKHFNNYDAKAQCSKASQQLCLSTWKRLLAGDTAVIKERLAKKDSTSSAASILCACA